jgi:putative methionine-R-sulfoxide reductase with GAF domain
VLVPASTELTDEVVSEINTAVQLDFLVPHIMDEEPDLLAIYYISTSGATHYYPNIDLANIVGDFDARTRPYYRAVTPEVNIARTPFWTVPYHDAALNGLVETNSIPLYDKQENFRGVIATDVLLTTLTDKIDNIEIGETGYAFLVDPGGRFIVLPQEALDDLGLSADALPEGGIPQSTIFDTTGEMRELASAMMREEIGLETFTRNGVEYYLAFAPISATGYELAVVVPVTEMIQLSLNVDNSVKAEERAALRTTILVTLFVLFAAFVFAYFLSRLLTGPLEQLTEAAGEISAGNYDVEVNANAGGEIGTLALAFNEMADQVQDLVGNLEQRVIDRTRALEASMDVSRSLSTILDYQQLVSEVVSQVQAAFHYYHVHIYLMDPESEDLKMAGGTGEVGKALLAGGHKIMLGQGLVGKAAADNEVVLAPDVAQEARWLPNPLLPDTKAETAVPISYGSDVLGVLDVQHDVVNGLTEEDVRTLQSIADQVAVALRNIRLYEQAQERAAQQAALNEITRRIHTAVDIDTVLRIAAQEIGKTVNAKRISVQLSQNAPDNGRQANTK